MIYWLMSNPNQNVNWTASTIHCYGEDIFIGVTKLSQELCPRAIQP